MDTGPIEVEPLPEDAAAVAAPALPPAMDDTPLDPQVARFDLIADDWSIKGTQTVEALQLDRREALRVVDMVVEELDEGHEAMS